MHQIEKGIEQNINLKRAVYKLRNPKTVWIKWEEQSLPEENQVVLAEYVNEDDKVITSLVFRENDHVWDYLADAIRFDAKFLSWTSLANIERKKRNNVRGK